jgi:hypothetical protein
MWCPCWHLRLCNGFGRSLAFEQKGDTLRICGGWPCLLGRCTIAPSKVCPTLWLLASPLSDYRSVTLSFRANSPLSHAWMGTTHITVPSTVMGKHHTVCIQVSLLSVTDDLVILSQHYISHDHHILCLYHNIIPLTHIYLWPVYWSSHHARPFHWQVMGPV